MFQSAFDRRPPTRATVSTSSGPDILAEERSRKSGRFSRVTMFWPGFWLTGPVGVVALVLFIVGGLVFAYWSDPDPSDIIGLSSNESLPQGIHPESGRALTGLESLKVDAIGKGLYLGPSGLPVIEHAETGEVREVTQTELDFLEEVSWTGEEVAHLGYNNVVWTPGPGGLGLWWQDQSDLEVLFPDLLFAQAGWRDKQEDELELAVRYVSLALREIPKFDYVLWNEGPGATIYHITDTLRDRYPSVEVGGWASVPDQWVCDEGLQARLNSFVTDGCPPGAYNMALAEAWHRLGIVSDFLLSMSRIAVAADGLTTSERTETDLLEEFIYRSADLLPLVEEADVALRDLRTLSAFHGLTLSVYLFDGV